MAGEATVDGEFWGAAGTRLLTGEARVRIVSTGGETIYGEIVRSAREGQHERTPLQGAIKALVAVLVVVALRCLRGARRGAILPGIWWSTPS